MQDIEGTVTLVFYDSGAGHEDGTSPGASCDNPLICGDQAAETELDVAALIASWATGDALGAETCGGPTCTGGHPDGSAAGRPNAAWTAGYLLQLTLSTFVGAVAGVFSTGRRANRADDAVDAADEAVRTGWRVGPNDLDWRGTGRTAREAVAEAEARIGMPRADMEITEWARDANGKSFPVQWNGPNGAEINIDVGHLEAGPGVPHVGFQIGRRRSRGNGMRGHILLDDVRASRPQR